MTPPASQAAFVTEHLDLIKRLAFARSATLSEELVQEACMMILSSPLPRGDGSISGYLYFKVLGAYRNLKRRERSGAVPATVVLPNQEHAADLALLRGRAAQLPDRQRRAVSLWLADNDYGEVGEAMGISKQAAHQLVRRAKPILGLAA